MPDAALRRTLAAAIAVTAALGAGAQTMYKWVDEKGVTHFSETPPPDDKTKAKASKVTPKVIPPSNPGGYNPEAWRTQESDAKKRQVERGKVEQADAKDREKRQAACQRARSRLSSLQNTQIFYRDNADGSRSYMSDAEREAEMGRAREAIKEHCD